jgi:hypothetical protein
MTAVRQKVRKQLDALKAPKGKKRAPKRKRVSDEDKDEEAGEEAGRSKRQKKNVAEGDEAPRVTRSVAAKTAERPRPRRIVKAR